MDNLSMDASRAKRDGMTYGFWKVLHPKTMGEVVVEDGNRICPCCGEAFFTKSKQRIYCSVECQRKVANKKAYERRMALAKG
jgi:ribosomal protein S27AE